MSIEGFVRSLPPKYQAIVGKAFEAAPKYEPSNELFFGSRLARHMRKLIHFLRKVSCVKDQVARELVNSAIEFKALYQLISSSKLTDTVKRDVVTFFQRLFIRALDMMNIVEKPVISILTTTPYNDMCTKTLFWTPASIEYPMKRNKMGSKVDFILEGDLVISMRSSDETVIIDDFSRCDEVSDSADFIFEGVSLSSVSSTDRGGARFQPFAVGISGKCAIRNTSTVPVKSGDCLEVIPNQGTIRLFDEAGERSPACAIPVSPKMSCADLFVLTPALSGGPCLVLVLP